MLEKLCIRLRRFQYKIARFPTIWSTWNAVIAFCKSCLIPDKLLWSTPCWRNRQKTLRHPSSLHCWAISCSFLWCLSREESKKTIRCTHFSSLPRACWKEREGFISSPAHISASIMTNSPAIAAICLMSPWLERVCWQSSVRKATNTRTRKLTWTAVNKLATLETSGWTNGTGIALLAWLKTLRIVLVVSSIVSSIPESPWRPPMFRLRLPKVGCVFLDNLECETGR